MQTGSTILQLCQDAAEDGALSLEAPSTLFATDFNGDTSPRKLFRALTRTVQHLAGRIDWEFLRAPKKWTATNTEVQYDAIPPDFLRFVPQTFFDETFRRHMAGPLPPQEWARQKAINFTQLYPSFVQRGSNIHILPVPARDTVFSYEYMSNAIGWSFASASPPWAPGPVPDVGVDATLGWAVGPATPTLVSPVKIQAFTADINVTFWDDELMRLGIIYQYRKSERMDYAEDMREFERLFAQRYKQDGGRRILDMGGRDLMSADARFRAMRNNVIITTGS